MLGKIISFFTGGLPVEIAKQVGENIKAKGDRVVQTFMQEIAFDLELLKAGMGDPLHTRQVIALTFHFFMWGKLFFTGHFPADIIFTYGDNQVTIGFVYCLIIVFYFPVRAIEKLKKVF
jgi:hypothetical protein